MWNISFDELEFGDVIGSGKFGEVYLGTYLGTPVAIKSMSEVVPQSSGANLLLRNIGE